ncbi:Uncharacterized membrane protein [Aliiroseovarius crassostreae]|uniref:DUF2339 domain-containing protein n=1 Tax=Aliiroseovarius crassostreae TaxID=154981 RepID=A0A0P7IZ69_9RHOB|nr:DUF2339 domain-containing protein [Aliiroseovarius crassostreae]KPN64121.1 hypothetical protein AKJ29_15820 [Aliiroseovarius crassostreae]SFU28567.1 Uncharacterized membrane protein [Aliiroseovarius crassostreae]
MESVLVLIALIYGLGLPVGVVYLLVRTARLGRENIDLGLRVRSAEQQLEALESRAQNDPLEGGTAATGQPRQAGLQEATPGSTVKPQSASGPASETTSQAASRAPWGDPKVAGRAPASGATPPSPTKAARQTDTVKPGLPAQKPAPRTPSAFDRMMGQLGSWLVQNWVYAVAAVSLALAGIFLVQYGIEAGLLPPTARVLAALGFGALLIGAGEYLRKRWGDGEDSPAAFLPSVFSGAGIVTLFAGLLAARHMYDLIGPTTLFAGLLLVAAGAIVLGWLTGPLLSVLGIVGAFVTPFLLGGSSDASPVVAHLGLVTLVGLAIDTYRRWKWLSALSIILGQILLVVLVRFADVDPEWVIGSALILPFAAVIVMGWRVLPRLPGAALLPHLVTTKSLRGLPRRMLLLQGLMAASVVWLMLSSTAGSAEFWLSVGALALLSGGMAIWARRCVAMEDLPILPAIGMLITAAMQPVLYLDVWQAFIVPVGQGALANGIERGVESDLRLAPAYLLALAVGVGIIAAWRSLTSDGHKRVWAFASAIFAPAMLVVLELTWVPANQIGAFRWALVVLAVAALMVIKLERFARAGDKDRMRLSLALISALGLISFALMLVLSPSALTVALALTVLVTVEIDRRFDLPLLEWFAVVGTILVSARLVLDPGLPWADDAPIRSVSFAFAGSILPLAAAWWLGKDRNRFKALVTLESAALSLTAIFAALLLDRAIETATGVQYEQHWGDGLNALIWMLVGAVQLWRLQLGGRLATLRLGLAAIYGVLALGYLARALLVDNPFTTYGEVIHGWPGLSTLGVAYALPALLLLGVARGMSHLPGKARLGFALGGAGLLAFWAVAEIAHFWRGPELAGQPMRQPELYTYTVALLLVGAGLLYQAIARGSDLMRRVAMGVIALTSAKVFLVDAAGLDGLMRVFSFLALGLSLVALAWLNRWAANRGKGDGDAPKPGPDP